MKTFWIWSVNLAIYVVLGVLLSTFQASIWLLIFGNFPPPHLWLTILAYWALHRPLQEAAVMAYLLALINSATTATPVSYMITANLLTVVALVLLKRRVYWRGSTFFMLAVSFATSTQFFSLAAIGWFKDVQPSTSLPILTWLTSVLFTTLLCLPLGSLYRFLDRIFDLDKSTGFEGGWL